MKRSAKLLTNSVRIAFTLSLLLHCMSSWGTNTVSRPVGFVRLLVEPNSDVLLGMPFEAFSSSIEGVIGDQLLGGDSFNTGDDILTWNLDSQQYRNYFYTYDVGDTNYNYKWIDTGTGEVATNGHIFLGDGFWLKNRHAVTQDVFLCGYVPLDQTNVISVVEGLKLFGYPFVSVLPLNASQLASCGAWGGTSTNDADLVYNPLGDTAFDEYEVLWLNNSSLNWLTTNGLYSDVVLRPGRGYWVKHVATNMFSWTEARPYADAFPQDWNPPQVVDMLVSTQGSSMTLVIETTGQSNELIEIYSQDLTATNAFDTTNGWLVVAQDIATSGHSETNWTDITGVSTSEIRMYLVARGDIDWDMDGIPNAREQFVHHTDVSDSDTDNDGVADGTEVARGTSPTDDQDLNTTIYADSGIGDNSYDGYAASVSGGHGPKSNIWASVDTAIHGDTVEIASGTYDESALNPGTKSIVLRPVGSAVIK